MLKKEEKNLSETLRSRERNYWREQYDNIPVARNSPLPFDRFGANALGQQVDIWLRHYVPSPKS